MSLHDNQYRAFASELTQMLNLTENHQAGNQGNQIDVAEIYRSLVGLQNFFQKNIISLAELGNDTSGIEQKYRTEMSKQMQLLDIDVKFLKNARQATTQKTKIESVRSRLNTLISYCQAVISSEQEQ